MLTAVAVTKVTIAFAVVLVFVRGAKRASAALKHAVLVAGQTAAIAIPLLGGIVPAMPIAVRTVQPHAALNAPAPDIGDAAPVPLARQRTRDVDSLFWLWLAGCSLVAASRLTSYIRAAGIVRRAETLNGLRVSEEVDQPSTFFHWILVPDKNVEKAVLLHEQAHVARRDTLLALIGDVASALYWFHPLAWLVARRATLERERACDDLVLARGIEPRDYASAMIAFARAMTRRTYAALPMAEPSQLEVRIRAILDPATHRRVSRASALAIVAVTLSAAPLLAALTPSTRIPRPTSIEPDLLGDSIASFWSERVEPPAPLRNVEATGRDAQLIERMLEASTIPKRATDDFVAERARWALTQIKDGELVTPLIDALEDHDWRIRAYAAWALGYSRDARAVEPLTKLMAEDIWRVRAMAAHSLASLSDPRAEEVMLRAIDDPAWQVRVEVVRYLRSIGADRATIDAMKRDRHMAVRAAAE